MGMKIEYALYTLEELLQYIKQDDRKAFDELYSKIWKELYLKAYSKLKDEDLAKDIIQEVFIDLWNKRQIREIKNVRSYLLQAIKFKVLDEFRKSHYDFVEIDLFVEKIKESQCADSQIISKEFFSAVENWTDVLPRKRKEVFKLKYIKGFSNKEIAAKLNISQKTVQNQVLNSAPELKKLLRRVLFILFLFLFGI